MRSLSAPNPLWIAFLAVLAVLIFGAADSFAGSWRTIQTKTANYILARPPVCTVNFDTKEKLLACLNNNKRWDFGYYSANWVGNINGSNRASLYGQIYEGIADGATFYYSAANSSNCSDTGSTQCMSVIATNSGGGVTVYGGLVASDGKYLNNDTWDKYFYRGKLNPAHGTVLAWGGNNPYHFASSPIITVAFFNNEEPTVTCVGKFAYQRMPTEIYASYAGGKGPTPEVDLYANRITECTYKYVDAGKVSGHLTGVACLTPLKNNAETVCHLEGKSDLAENAPLPEGATNDDRLQFASSANPVLLTIGKTERFQKDMKIPEFADLALGWGAKYASVDITEDQLLAAMPILVSNWAELNNAQQVSLMAAWISEGLIDLKAEFKAGPNEVQDYYHPGNFDAAGNNIGSFDRDWGKTEYSADKAFNWDRMTPATAVSKDQLEVIKKDLDTQKNQVVASTSAPDSTKIQWPPGVTGNNGVVTPPSPTPSNPGSGGNSGDSEDTPWPSVGEWLGSYEKKGSLYDSKYPDGLGGAINDALADAQEKSGAGDVIGILAFEGRTSIVGDLCYAFPVSVLGWNFASPDSRGICIPDGLLSMMKAFFIFGSGIYSIRLIFGGD